jgi:nitronate monooxygenase
MNELLKKIGIGEFGYGAQRAGQGGPLARSLPAATLVAELRAEMEQALRRRTEWDS